MFRTYATALAVAGALLMAGAAGAAEPTVVDQYTEQVPTPGGEKPVKEVPSTPDAGGPEGSSTPVAAAPSGGTGGGSAGVAAAPGENTARSGDADPGDAGDTAKDSAGGQDTGTAGITEDSDSSGMGLVFPLILLACLVAVAAVVIARRRGGAGPRAT
ncbi:MAG TPA: hypothetical protein VMF31_06655 [Solirubrobacterales bacterium]|nr:hypothetical protein [Solirubrobacterales bacterium]